MYFNSTSINITKLNPFHSIQSNTGVYINQKYKGYLSLKKKFKRIKPI